MVSHAAQAVKPSQQPAGASSQPQPLGPPEQCAAAGADLAAAAAVSLAKPAADPAGSTQPKPQQAAAKAAGQQMNQFKSAGAKKVQQPAVRAVDISAVTRPAADTTGVHQQPAAPRQQAAEPCVPTSAVQPISRQSGAAAVQPAAMAQQTQEPPSGALQSLAATPEPMPQQQQQQQRLTCAAPPPPPSQHQQGKAEPAAALASAAVVPHAAIAGSPHILLLGPDGIASLCSFEHQHSHSVDHSALEY